MTERRNNQRSTTLQGRAHEAEALTHPVIASLFYLVIASRRRGNLSGGVFLEIVSSLAPSLRSGLWLTLAMTEREVIRRAEGKAIL